MELTSFGDPYVTFPDFRRWRKNNRMVHGLLYESGRSDVCAAPSYPHCSVDLFYTSPSSGNQVDGSTLV